jgi:hypothetical protein
LPVDKEKTKNGHPSDSYRPYCQGAPRYPSPFRLYLYRRKAFAGSIFFVKEGSGIPDNREVGGLPRLYFPAGRFEEIMSILRHEKPLFMKLTPSTGVGLVSTSNEPVGEEEDG